MPNPFTFKPRQKPYSLDSLTQLKNEANKLFQAKKYNEAVVAYENIYTNYAHNEEDDLVVLHMVCKSNLVACLLALWKETRNAWEESNFDSQKYNADFALVLCNEILKCEEAHELHIKALYRKILVLQHMERIEDAMKETAEAMKRFPNATFFRQLFDQITEAETQRRQQKLSEDQQKKVQQIARFTLFHEENKIHAMHINSKRWHTQELNHMAQGTLKYMQSHGKDCTSVSVFHFNAHDATAHISYVDAEQKDERDILDEACRAFFDLDARSTSQSFLYDSDERVVAAYDQKESRIDSSELEQYQQLAMVMRDRFGKGVTVSVMKE